MKKSGIILFLTMICFVAFPTISHAQIIDPNDVPIDGGLSLLVAAGAAYGIKKYKDSRKKGDEQADLK